MASATITVLSTAYYVATADNYYEACEAGLRGTGGGIGSVLANMVMPDGWTAFAKSMVGGTVGSYLGGKMAPWVCTVEGGSLSEDCLVSIFVSYIKWPKCRTLVPKFWP